MRLSNEQVKEKVSDITKGTKTLKEAAREIFYFVRDEILFNATLDIFRKASSTLKDGTVDYCNKITLLCYGQRVFPPDFVLSA